MSDQSSTAPSLPTITAEQMLAMMEQNGAQLPFFATRADADAPPREYRGPAPETRQPAPFQGIPPQPSTLPASEKERTRPW